MDTNTRTMPSVEDLFGGGVTSLSFDHVGVSHTGTVVATEARQVTDLDGNPKVWDDGKPVMQLVVTLQTAARDDADDDGIRKLYAKGLMLTEFKKAIRAAKLKAPEVGATVTVTYVADGEPTKRGFNPPKIYTVTYVSPKEKAVEAIFDEPAKPAAAAPAPAVGVDLESKRAELRSLGIAEDQIDRALGALS